MPAMICLMLPTATMGGASGSAAACGVERPAATTKPMPDTNSATLTTNNQCTMRIGQLLQNHQQVARFD